jgi:hypothetical protein
MDAASAATWAASPERMRSASSVPLPSDEVIGCGARISAHHRQPMHLRVHARDRIGRGPWINAQGIQIAASVDELHSEDVNLTRDTALTEEGKYVAPTRHDILTGSNADGTLMTGGDATCGGWTSHSEGRAMVGHHNRSGGGRGDSWNAAHPSRGCSQAALRASLGDGLLYCFAAD